MPKNPDQADVEALTGIDHDLQINRLKHSAQAADQKTKLLSARIAQLEDELDACKSIQEIDTITIPPGTPNQHESTAVALLSDTHIEEEVDPLTVNGKNTFTLAIAKSRMSAFFQNLRKLIEGKRKSIKINNLILALLGDFISNDIHEELMETAQLSPIEAIIVAQNLIASGIEHLLEIKGLSIYLPCHSGNHARTTKKVRHATEKGHSLEYYMFHVLANHFRGNPRVTFAIAPGYHSYADVNGFKLRFHHGHNIRYWGGVGGITIPVNKAIAQWNKTQAADLDCFGHFHQFFYGGNFVCNGSLIGYNAFSIAIKGSYERPKQAFFLVHHRRREPMDICPVWVD